VQRIMNKPIAVIIGVVVVALLVLFSATFTVRYNEVAIRTTFGKITDRSVVVDPGLHLRLPIFIDKVHRLDTRLQVLESPLEEITTADGLQLVVRAFLLWRVDAESDQGPIRFYERYGSVDGATSLLEAQFRTAFTGGVSQYRFGDLIGPETQLEAAEERVRQTLLASIGQTGVEPVAVGISQVLFPPRTSRAVLERMKAGRDVVAQSENAKGTAEASRIRAEASTRAEKIRAFAVQRAEEIRAQGDLQSARYLEEMNRNPELAVFLIWLDTLRKSLGENTTFVVPTDQQPFHLLNLPVDGNVSRVPQASAPPRPAVTEAGGQ